MTTTDPTTDCDLLGAVEDLGDALRHALEASVTTAAPPEVLREVAAAIRSAVAPLSAATRARSELFPLDDMHRGVRVFNPADGVGNAIAPPIHCEPDGDGVLARFTFGQVYEGPPTLLHGGISALLMDQVLGSAAIAAGRWGMTVNLELRYRRPVPLHTQLRLTARVAGIDGRRTSVTGGIATEDAPEAILVEAAATFVSLSPEVAARFFDGPPAADRVTADEQPDTA